MSVAVELCDGAWTLGPLFRGQWFAIFDDDRLPPSPNAVGRLCIVGLASGQAFIKVLRRGQLPNRWNLHSYSEPPVYDAEVEWVAPVKALWPPEAKPKSRRVQ